MRLEPAPQPFDSYAVFRLARLRNFLLSILFCLPLFLCQKADLLAQPVDEEVLPIDSIDVGLQRPAVRDLDVVSIGGELIAPSGGDEFFNGYRRLGGPSNALGIRLAPTFTARLLLGRGFRLLANVSYSRVGFHDVYEVRAPNPDNPDLPGPSLASIADEMTMGIIPAMAGVQFSPRHSQFSTYVGATGGLAVMFGEWTTLSRPQPGEFYRPGVNLRGPIIAPAARIFTGLDLRFDRYYQSSNAVRGIFLEAAFLLLPMRAAYFKSIRQEGRGLPAVPEADEATMSVGGFSLSLGLNLQFPRR